MAGDKNFSFTDPKRPLFGPDYQAIKERASKAMEELERALRPQGKTSVPSAGKKWADRLDAAVEGVEALSKRFDSFAARRSDADELQSFTYTIKNRKTGETRENKIKAKNKAEAIQRIGTSNTGGSWKPDYQSVKADTMTIAEATALAAKHAGHAAQSRQGRADGSPEVAAFLERKAARKALSEAGIAKTNLLMAQVEAHLKSLKKQNRTPSNGRASGAKDQVKTARAHFGLALNSLDNGDTQKYDRWMASAAMELTKAEGYVQALEQDVNRV